MKKILTLYFVLSYSVTAAQNILYSLSTSVNTPCVYNNQQPTLQVQGWETYLTYNNAWDGPRDTTFCDDAFTTMPYTGGKIDLANIDTSRTIFIRCLIDSASAIALTPNYIYKFSSLVGFANTALADTMSMGPSGYNTGVMVGIEIPDSSGNGKAMRWHHSKLNVATNTCVVNDFCFVTENFGSNNRVREIIFKFKSAQNIVGNIGALLSCEIVVPIFAPLPLTDSTSFFPFSFGPFYYLLPIFYDYLVMHNNTYPVAANMSYVDVRPNPNTNQVGTIDLIVYGPLFFQPYTQLRAGMVLNDTIRHNLNVVLNGGNICIGNIVELLMDKGKSLTYEQGTITFDGPMGCMLFGNGGTLKVNDNRTFTYGNSSCGMLGLKTGANIIIGKNATLNIGNHVNMMEYAEESAPANIYLQLNSGSTLRFLKGARLTNFHSKDSTMQMVVYMNGGILDESGLSATDRKLIKRVYPPSLSLQHFSLVNNVTYDVLNIVSAVQQEIEVLDMAGKVVHKTTVKDGISTIELSTLHKGVYVVRNTSTPVYSTKFIKL